MKTVTARDLQKKVKECVDWSQEDRIVITRHGKAGRRDGWSRGQRLGGSRTADVFNFLETCRGTEKAADDLHVPAQIPFEEAKDVDLLILTF